MNRTEMVKVLVGRSQESVWVIHKELLTSNSFFAEDALFGFEPGEELEIRLPQEDPAVFGVFVRRLYGSSAEFPSLDSMFRFYLLCRRLQVDTLCDVIATYVSSNSVPFTLAQMEYILDETTPADLLRFSCLRALFAAGQRLRKSHFGADVDLWVQLCRKHGSEILAHHLGLYEEVVIAAQETGTIASGSQASQEQSVRNADTSLTPTSPDQSVYLSPAPPPSLSKQSTSSRPAVPGSTAPLADGHHSTMFAKSQPEHTALFRATLPVATPSSVGEPQAPLSARQSTEARSSSPTLPETPASSILGRYPALDKLFDPPPQTAPARVSALTVSKDVSERLAELAAALSLSSANGHAPIVLGPSANLSRPSGEAPASTNKGQPQSVLGLAPSRNETASVLVPQSTKIGGMQPDRTARGAWRSDSLENPIDSERSTEKSKMQSKGFGVESSLGQSDGFKPFSAPMLGSPGDKSTLPTQAPPGCEPS
jgi:hypothetical protein